jgi:spore maturation protein CgeB
LRIFGYGGDQLTPDLRALHHGERWGVDMYRVLLRSQITLNRHIDVAEGYANNMRLFEATGCGALLVTDRGRNLRDYFSDEEVLSYASPTEARSLINWAYREPEQAKEMARRAQQRTLTEHSYSRRMGDLNEALIRRLGGQTT